jgi:hypothetical protein
VALAEALETVSHDRLTRRLQSDWSGQRRLELALRALFVWERGSLVIDDTVIPTPFAAAIEDLAWVFSSLGRTPEYGLSFALLVRTSSFVVKTSPLVRRIAITSLDYPGADSPVDFP